MAVTIHDVAREAGVAISTVSKVINGSTRISRETADRIREIMKRMDFHPNSIARAFASQTSGTVCVLMEMRREAAYDNPYIYEILGGIEDVLNDQGYLLSLANILSPRDIKGVLEKMIRAKRVDGYILHSSTVSREIIRFLNEFPVPFVVVGEMEGPASLCWVDADNGAAGNLAMSHLVATGRKRPAFIGGVEGDTISARRLQGARDSLEKAGMSLDPALVARIEITAGNAERSMAGMLALPPGQRPDAVICVSNFAAVGAIKAIKDAGLRIPRDIAVSGFDNYPLAPYLDPPLTVIDMDMYSLGRHAGEAILFKLKHPGAALSVRMLEPRLIARASTV